MNKEKKSFSVNYEEIVRKGIDTLLIAGTKIVFAKDPNEAVLVCQSQVKKETKYPKDLIDVGIDEIEERGVLPL